MDILQWIMFGVILFTMLCELFLLRYQKNKCWLLIPFLSWFFLSLLYYAGLELEMPMDGHLWGQVLRLQGYVTVALLSIFRIAELIKIHKNSSL